MYSKDIVDSVVQELEKFAQDSQISELENLAKIAIFQDGLNKVKKTEKTAAQSQTSNLYTSLAAAVTLGR